MFAQTLRVTVDLLLLRRGPQDLPANWNLLAALSLLYISLHFAQASTAVETGPALLQAAFAAGLLALYVRGVLQARDVAARFAQTLSALFAIGVLATLLLLGPTASMAPFLEEMAQGGDMEGAQPPMLALLASLVVSVWALVASGHVYRHALDIRLGLGILVALGFEFLLLLVFALIGGAGA